MLGAGEDQGAVGRFAPQHVDEDGWLRSVIDADKTLPDSFSGRRHRRDCGSHRIAEHLRRQVGDRARHRRRKHQSWTDRRKLGDDFADVVNKAHVQHAIGLVEHETFDLIEPERIAFDQIDETARRGDQDVNAVEQGANLGGVIASLSLKS